MPEVLDHLYRLKTPVAISISNKKIDDWCYNVNEIPNLKGKEVKYMKGLGSWDKNSLSCVIKKDNLENMFLKLDYIPERDNEHIHNWFDKDKKDKRKEMILKSEFSLIKV